MIYFYNEAQKTHHFIFQEFDVLEHDFAKLCFKWKRRLDFFRIGRVQASDYSSHYCLVYGQSLGMQMQ